MATKDELVAFAEARGIGVDSSMLKADIETAIYDAGYDPNDLEGTMGTEEIEAYVEEVEGTSSDASFSTYTEVDPDPEGEIRPAPGRHVEQTRGEPSEGGGTVFRANR